MFFIPPRNTNKMSSFDRKVDYESSQAALRIMLLWAIIILVIIIAVAYIL